jgi:hypothetical protein
MRGWIPAISVIALICIIIGGIVTLLTIHNNAYYGSMRYAEAETGMQHVMADTYGLSSLDGLRFANPNVVNTHLDKINQEWTRTNTVRKISDRGQVRVFQLVGAEGVKWCVGLWDYDYGSKPYYGKYFVIKNCRFLKKQ